ncbi:MAG TPA: hypothetical protein VFC93_09385 [Chloroflexota bacterium]|nr:hypothetical protein [Chloroflexota bacterium]
MPPRFRVVLTPRALEQWQRMGQEAFEETDRIFGLLEVDPYADGEQKHIVRIGDEARLYYDGDLVWVQYHVIDNEVVSVLTCSDWRGRRPGPPIL